MAVEICDVFSLFCGKIATSVPNQMLQKLLLSRQFLPLQEHTVESVADTLILFLRRCKSPRTVQQIHTQMLINAIEKPNFLIPKLVDDLKDMPYAYLVFSQIPHPNEYVFNYMIRGITKVWHKYGMAIEFYHKMKSFGLKPDKFTYPFLFIACANLVELDHGRSAHSCAFKSGLGTNHHVTHSLITMYSMCTKLDDARKVFDEIPFRDSVSWNSMISGYAKMGHASDAVELFRKMKDEGFVPDEMTVVSTLSACGDLGDLSLGKWIESFVLENQLEVNTFVGSALIGMYGKCGDLLSARRIFDGMLRKDAITWNAMITGYAQSGSADEAITLFNLMKEAGVKPNNITLTLVLSSCASIGALDLGKWVDTYVTQLGIKHDVYIGTALVDMYAKCGSLDDALNTFEDMPQKNDVSWNAMISALASHGRAEEALTLFEHMLGEGGSIHPSDITFVAVLSACVHAGLVNEGRRFFSLMNSLGLVPKVEHFSCMVDLFSRAGLLYEAWDFIEKMPGKPDEVTLGALLGACQKRRNTEVGERVMQLILEIEPSNSGNYVISSKLYADVNRWDDSARMRMLMREKGISKLPGCSWMENEGGQLIEFHAGDQLHEVTSEVYVILVDEMRREGYIPTTYFPKAAENGEM